MNQEKIGKFISECRKEMQLTQEQLAFQLEVTSKSISKWETGKCLPDASKYETLCKVLGITVNELFLGERLSSETEAKDCLIDLLASRIYDADCSVKKPYMEDFLHNEQSSYCEYCALPKSTDFGNVLRISVSYEEFKNALLRMSEITVILSKFKSKEAAVEYLVKETGITFEECSNAYDYYFNLFKAKHL